MRVWKTNVGTAWLPRLVLQEMIDEADRAYPDETGGVLMGYWASPFDEVVVTHVIGPGPGAVHRRSKFVPDSAYQQEQITRHYERSRQLETYLGDWHTHPRSGARLSRIDRRTLWRIAAAPEARAPAPLMAVLSHKASWNLRIWRGTRVRLGRLALGLRVAELMPKTF